MPSKSLPHTSLPGPGSPPGRPPNGHGDAVLAPTDIGQVCTSFVKRYSGAGRAPPPAAPCHTGASFSRRSQVVVHRLPIDHLTDVWAGKAHRPSKGKTRSSFPACFAALSCPSSGTGKGRAHSRGNAGMGVAHFRPRAAANHHSGSQSPGHARESNRRSHQLL